MAKVEFGNTTVALSEAQLQELGAQPRIVHKGIEKLRAERRFL